MPSNDDRIRQAEIDTARAREIAEEARDRREQRGERNGNALIMQLGGAIAVTKAAIVRDFVRSVMIPPTIARLFDIGMGYAEFETVVPGSETGTVQLEAPASVQVMALKTLVDIGIPRQLGILDGGDEDKSGVFYLGGPQMAEARRAAGDAGYMGNQGRARTTDAEGTLLPEAMQARVDAGEFEVVEVEEGDGQLNPRDPDAPDPVASNGSNGNGNGTLPTLEQQILSRRRQGRANGKR